MTADLSLRDAHEITCAAVNGRQEVDEYGGRIVIGLADGDQPTVAVHNQTTGDFTHSRFTVAQLREWYTDLSALLGSRKADTYGTTAQDGVICVRRNADYDTVIDVELETGKGTAWVAVGADAQTDLWYALGRFLDDLS